MPALIRYYIRYQPKRESAPRYYYYCVYGIPMYRSTKAGAFKTSDEALIEKILAELKILNPFHDLAIVEIKE
jgi:hypothetical protein